MEYTLEDAFDTLKEKKKEQKENIEDLINKISNNEVFSLKSTSSLEDMKKKRNKFYESLKKEIQQMQPEDYPIPTTSDLRVEVITEMEAEIHNMEELLSNLQQKLSDIQDDIKYLRNKKDGLEKMQESYLDIVSFEDKTYEKKCALSKRIFLEVKHDLSVVVNKIFPDNDGFEELLAALTSAYMKGGDDMYIDVTPNALHYINFLFEADIIQYHRNDKTKIKMTELL